jgi:hypothetical protein
MLATASACSTGAFCPLQAADLEAVWDRVESQVGPGSWGTQLDQEKLGMLTMLDLIVSCADTGQVDQQISPCGGRGVDTEQQAHYSQARCVFLNLWFDQHDISQQRNLLVERCS